MELRQLSCFIAVAEERHFGRAAARLRMAQPQLSQTVRHLEEQLGARLLERTTRRVDLTPAGQELLDRGRRLVQDAAALTADVSRLGSGTGGSLRSGFCGAATYGFMPRMVRGLGGRLPGIALQVRGELSGPVAEAALREGSLDLAVLHPPVASGELESRTLCRDPLVVAVREGGPLDTGDPLTVAELAAHEFVAQPPDSVVHRTVAALFQDAGFAWRIGQVVPETAQQLAHVAAGTGVAVVPRSVRALHLEGVVYAELGEQATVDLALVWRGGNRSPVLRGVLEELADLAETA